MEVALATKTEETKSSRIPSPAIPETGLLHDSEAGAPAGLPIFLQGFQQFDEEGARAKLAISQPNDPDEQEADLVAERVMRMRDPAPATPCPDCSGEGESCSHCGQKAATQIQRRAKVATGQQLPSNAPQSMNHLGSGYALETSARAFFEPRFGQDFSQVRVHTGTPAAESARAVQARAFTVGQDLVFAEGEYSAESPEGRKLLAHELAHTLQPSPQSRLRRNVPPPPSERLLSPAEQARRDEQMGTYLGGQSRQMLAVDQRLSNADPHNADEREALEETLLSAVRLNALGLMASHRASIEEARDRIEGRNRFPVEGEPPAQSTHSALLEMREAAQVVSNLQGIEGRLQTYRDALGDANRDARHQSGSVGDTLHLIATNGTEFLDEHLRTGLREGWHAAAQSSSYWLWAIGASQALIELRDQQIAGIRLAISEVYTRFPLFAQLAPSGVGTRGLASDQALLESSRLAYQRVLRKVDDAIHSIATDDIHPFDLPKAVESTRAGKPPAVQQALDEAIERHGRNRFWLNLTLTVAEILLCFIPVVGPALALGLGAVALGMSVEDMLDRLTVGRASTDPYDNPVGVSEPSGFEWVMTGVAGILLAFGGVGIARSAMRGFRTFQTLGRLAPELSAGTRMRLTRIISSQPELLAAPRTSGALETDLRAAGIEASATEIRALRAASYEQAGLPVPRSSSESLDAFLDDIWNDQQTILAQARRRGAQGWRSVYRRYSQADQPNPLRMSHQDYLAHLDRIRAGRPPGVVSDIQGDPIQGFHRFERAGSDLGLVRERIYLNVTADQAPEVMESVVQNIVDNPAVPGVQMAKLSGPGAVSSRADAIVIYLDDPAAVEGVLARIRNYQRAAPRNFRAGGPALTEEVSEGVSVGAEPDVMHGPRESFGTIRSRAVYQALDETAAASGNREQFISRVRDLLRAAGVNPEAPHLNLPPATPGGPGLPPTSGTPGGTPVMPALIAGQRDRDSQE